MVSRFLVYSSSSHIFLFCFYTLSISNLEVVFCHSLFLGRLVLYKSTATSPFVKSFSTCIKHWITSIGCETAFALAFKISYWFTLPPFQPLASNCSNARQSSSHSCWPSIVKGDVYTSIYSPSHRAENDILFRCRCRWKQFRSGQNQHYG
jgi:hypothetical protein